MSWIIIKYFRCEDLTQLYTELATTMTVLKWMSAIIIFLKYMFQFQIYLKPNTELETYLETHIDNYTLKLPFIEKMFGL